jgi:hypothetical protein
MHLTPRQLAARWQVSEKTLERWRHEGTGPSFLKIVGRILYPLAGIETIEARHTHPVASNPLSVGDDPGKAAQRIAGSHERV